MVRFPVTVFIYNFYGWAFICWTTFARTSSKVPGQVLGGAISYKGKSCLIFIGGGVDGLGALLEPLHEAEQALLPDHLTPVPGLVIVEQIPERVFCKLDSEVK